ncbi:tetratricopeptide repeat protein [Maribacter polysaccharolyticus]|uniref:tetratricopeptide repeat protein n=1 Tax=Maribacter polysaccharolyticus TaxID=3020831 RepID=UPI00237F7968|nr:tetratricopeptide repeat protein [Maribacter polysaccharolyticus]MDE3742649.1 tetratricopeptide repeat protein [Maribacter polysaccharolyticus]
MKLNLPFVLLFCIYTAIAQSPMEKGFKLLETGQFAAAELFFESYLEKDPANKTAQICYGRAMGLNGEPKKANTLFARLLETYPGDFEIQINYNESFLWIKDYQTAKPLYADLVTQNPDNFGAILGYANTLSNLMEYENALHWVEKALAIQPGNEGAEVSRKYMRLGYANSLVNGQKYEKGKAQLNTILTDFPEDKEALLNLANLFLITKAVDSAKATYRRYATSPKDSITALNGIALAEHINEKDKKALSVAEIAMTKVTELNDPALLERTLERYVQALIWNRKFKSASQQIDSLFRAYPNKTWVHALNATLGLYTSDAKKGIESYDAILAQDSASFDGNLGKANALFAADQIDEAYNAAFKTLEIFKNQKDAMGFIEKLNAIHTPSIEEHAAYTFDNGNNIAFYTTTRADISLSTKFRTTVSYSYRTTENTETLNKAESHVLLAGLAYRLLPKTKLTTIFGFNNSISSTASYTQPVLDIKLQLQPFKLQNLNLGYQREVQNFNADLTELEIVQNHYGLDYNLGTNFDLGWYTQLMHTQQTDGNRRNLLFTSLYYNLLRKPALKTGINFQYITFKAQYPTIYFSPEQYKAVEIFVDMRGKFSGKTTYMVSAASGLQQVEQETQTTIFRAETSLQHQFSKRFSANLYAKYSNIASATAAGFEFTEVGLKLKWLLTKKPLFFTKLGN